VKKEGTLRLLCRHRPVQYLNNILEQDHRAIKRRVKAKQGFRTFHAAWRTIASMTVAVRPDSVTTSVFHYDANCQTCEMAFWQHRDPTRPFGPWRALDEKCGCS
jgi:transposase-like protein